MKKIILFIVVLFLMFGVSFAYMEDKVFCTIGIDSVTVTMEKSGNYKCAEYIKVLSQAINTEYQNILVIQNLIRQGYDVSFREDIRDDKRDKIVKLATFKNQIESAVEEFDANLFVKLKDYIGYIISPYLAKYSRALTTLEEYKAGGNYVDLYTSKLMKNLQDDIAIMNIIMETDNFDEFAKNYNKHIYLKKQIEGK